MQVLVWHGKYGDVIVAARDMDELQRAYLYLFEQMDQLQYYHHLEDDWSNEQCVRARRGDAEAAENLLESRLDYEYEGISVETIIEP